MSCHADAGNVQDGQFTWTGSFTSSSSGSSYDREILLYNPDDHNWWLGQSSPSGQFTWTLVGNTWKLVGSTGVGFGPLNDGRPFWTGKFTGSGRTEILFYTPADDNWWLGSISGIYNPSGQLIWTLAWTLVGNTGAAFGSPLNDGRPFWIEDFSGSGRTEILFYCPGDDYWWLGSISAGQLTWTPVGNTAADFGSPLNDGSPFWTGYFSNLSRAEILFYFPGDHNWWLGSISAGQLTWTLVGNTAGFGLLNDGRPFWIDDFNADARSDIMFHYPGDGNWWLGSVSTSRQLTWKFVGSTRDNNTNNFGNIWPKCRFWVGYFRGYFRADIMFYNPDDGNWWLGTLSGQRLSWSKVGNTSTFGNIKSRPFWKGYLKGHGGIDLLFYNSGDGNWWLGSISTGQLSWTLSANTGLGFESKIKVHFKFLSTPSTPITTILNNMRTVFSTAGILVILGSTEELTVFPSLMDLQDIKVADCQLNVWLQS